MRKESVKQTLTLKEIEGCFQADTIELLENYPADPRGHSFLILGFTQDDDAVHFVCSIHEETLIVITLYRPDPDQWVKLRKRLK